MAKNTPSKKLGKTALYPLVRQPGSGNLLAKREGGEYSLLDHVADGTLSLPRRYSEQRRFFRFLRRAGKDRQLKEAVRQLRDAVILAGMKKPSGTGGLAVALTGPRGGEGASFLSLMLGLSLGCCTHRRVAVLDGRFSVKRFGVLTEMLGLSRDSVCLQKGESEILGYYNEAYPNVYFLKNTGSERGLEFFSDKELQIFMADLRRHFDFAIIDMPPLLQETSNLFLAPAVDELYLVVAARKTRLTDVERAVYVTKEAGGQVAGVIVNKQKAPWWSRLFWRDFFF